MMIKQSAALFVLAAAVAIAGAGCFRQNAPAAVEPVSTIPGQPAEPERGEPASDWVRYSKDTAGQIGMSFLYPPQLAPVPWDTEAWGTDAVGADFTGFGVARIPNPDRLTVEEWLARRYPGVPFDLSAVDVNDPFVGAVEGACDATVVTDDFSRADGPSGIGGTVFVSVGDASLYAFTLGQDWDQELGPREEVIADIFQSIEWFAERTSCPETTAFRDDALGIAFSYPTAWGPILSAEESGWVGLDADDDSDYTNPDCVSQRMLAVSGVESHAILLAAGNVGDCDQPGRGGYFGDQSKGFASNAAIASWCAEHDECESFTNAQGVRVYHAYTERMEDWGDTYEDVDEYAVFHEGAELSGIILSNQRLIGNGLGRSETELRALVDSLSYTN